MAQAGLGAINSSRRIQEQLEEQEWHKHLSHRPRRSAPAFVAATLPQYSLDGTLSESSATLKKSVHASTTGEEAQRIYRDVLSSLPASARAPVATTSQYTLDMPVAASEHTTEALGAGTGTSRDDAIDIDDDPILSTPIPANMQYCEVCQTEVPHFRWQAHILSLAHVLGSDTSAATKLPPYIAIKETNPGRIMLSSQGYIDGQGLGAAGSGRPTPLRPVEKQDRLGIGLVKRKSNSPKPRVADLKLQESVKEREKRMKREQQSWNQLYSYIKDDR